ncbi:MAG: hypothetical protein R8N24_00320 [Alphaproteobacteria bacterium]|nr:hypothetical protein [Alphaproteobacteria bacterium]
MAYSKAFKQAVLKDAKKFGSTYASKKHQIPHKTILRWNKESPTYKTNTQRRFSEELKREILTYANNHGLTSAMHKYNVDVHTILEWNKTRHIYEQTGRRKNATYAKQYERVDEATKQEILLYAKRYGISKASKKYNMPISTIQYWNGTRKVYALRHKRTFSEKLKKEIIQYAADTTIANAAKQFNLTSYQIKQWISARDKTK